LKIAIISDIHGNLFALESTLKALDDLKPDSIICLGDVVGYGAQPNECCELIKNNVDETVIGNHDAGCCGILDFAWFNPVATQSLEWTARNLSDENMEWLRNLPYEHKMDKLIFTHAMLYKKEEFYYDDELIPIYYSFVEMENDYRISFIGHSHKYNILKARSSDNRLENWSNDNNLNIVDDFKYIINVGSVGQPRDKNADSTVVTCEIEEGSPVSTELHRIKYDIDAAAKSIIDNDLPSILAERLFLGI